MIQNEEYLSLKKQLFDKYYEKLNDKQREAVYTVNGPLLILAGAGSGKTTVLVNRISHIIRYGNAYYSTLTPPDVSESDILSMRDALSLSHDELGEFLMRFRVNPAPAWSVMGITFTNKAANEIKTRISGVFGEDSDEVREIRTGTFHSICVRILRRWGERIGYAQGFGICDMTDSKKELSECMKKLNIDEKTFPVKSIQNEISRAKDKLMTPEDLLREAGTDIKLRRTAEVYDLYAKRLKSQNLFDFDDIIMRTVELIETDSEVREKLQHTYRYVCVDEYQDTNYAQLKLTLLLSDFYRNIMVVGDDDQSIYKFRGAVIENILNFDKNYDNTKVIKLEENYRSTSTILEAANAVISNNSGRLGKTLWTSGERGDKIVIKNLRTQNDESRYLSDEITARVRDKKNKFCDFAVLYRMNTQSRVIEQAFAKSGIPYRMLGGMRFFDRMEVKDIVSYLQVINNPLDDIRLSRIINVPRRGIGDKSFGIAETLAYETGFSILEFMKNARQYTAISTGAANSMRDFAYLIDSLREDASRMCVSDLIRRVIDITGYGAMIDEIKEKNEREERQSNLEELISAAVQYEDSADDPNLLEFLEEVALVSDIDKYDEEADAVVLMTIHSAKGLEFPVVFLPGMEENIFPSYMTVMNPDEIEEERRLAYVAITRAKRNLYITHVNDRMLNGRTQYNMLSRFAAEIPQALVERADDGNISARSFAPRKADYAVREANKVKSGARAAGLVEATRSTPIPQRQSTGSIEKFKAGDSIKHPVFGSGVILSVKPMGGDILYEIVFESAGTKRLMATYAKLKRA
ncbi:MAG: UvrD-helicase domain-containing protein [Clostridiales bacterium]|nr:UvrD-helicase domain-containing protein [Clostridiales bacterium]